MPPTKPCPKTLIATRVRKAGSGKMSTASMIGRFASPSLRKGRGLGIMYSMVERKKQRA